MERGIGELGKRLFNLMNKLGCQTSQYEGQDWSIELLKDFIYDIDEKSHQQ